jgi:hypothetical protein
MRRIGWGSWILIAGLGLAIVVGVAMAALLMARPRDRAAPNLNESTFVAVSLPQNGSFLPLHDMHTVVVESYAASGVSELQLWINNQLWGSATLTPARDSVTHTWAWVPSGEGEHHLVARAIDGSGAAVESPVVNVYATQSIDILLPLSHSSQDGDTVASLAESLGSTEASILESNPQLDPDGPIPPGTELTIPVPFPSPPSQTESGEPAAPPAGGPVVPQGSSVEEVVAGVHQAQAGTGPVLWRAFDLIDGKLTPDDPVDLLYLYLSVNGADWGRLPEDPHDYLHPEGGTFDLKSYLQSVVVKSGGGPVQIHAEAWGWRQGGLTYLGSYFGEVTTEAGGLQTTASGATELRMIDFVYLAKENYKQFAVLTGDDPDLDESFRWTTSLPAVTYGLWQVSDKPFPPGSTLNPPGLIHQGVSGGHGGKFSLDFADYFLFLSGGGGGDWFGGIDFPTSLDDLLGLKQEPTQNFNPWLAKGFFVRVIPMTGAALPGVSGQVAGPASKPLMIIYTPKGTPYSPKSPPNGPVYEARVVGFQPYRPADPDYGACMIYNYEDRDCHNVFGYAGGVESLQWSSISLQDVENGQLTMAQYQQCSIRIPKGTHACGCPGVPCSSSSSSCELSFEGFGNCLQKGAGALGGALSSLASFGASLYNGAVDFVTDALSSVACGALSGDAKKACEAGVGIAVNVGLASLGLPPEIPDFEKLMNEGLDYALAVAAEELSAQLGFECDKFCQDLVKAGIEGLSDPEKLMDDGLAFAASHAADELKDLGVECDAKCQGLIQKAAEGDLALSLAFNAALDQAAAEAAAQLNANGYPCAAACQGAILQSMEDSRDLISSAKDAAASKPTPPPFLPHPLAVTQPAVVTVEIFRRWESGGIPQEDLNKCGLSLFTSETTPVGGSQITFSPFVGKGLELPYLDPGETIRIPVALDRKFTDITQEMIDAVAAEQVAKGDPVIAGAVGGLVSDGTVVSGENLLAWRELYYGGVLQIKLTGPPFLTVVDGSAKGLPCVAEETWPTTISEP